MAFVLVLLLGSGLSPHPDRFPLFPTMGNEGASGMVHLTQPWSPFGVSVDEDGRVVYDLRIEVEGLPALESGDYMVWITTPALDSIVALGSLDQSGVATGSTNWEQLMVVVTVEPAGREAGERWSGPIVLRGVSAGARVTPLAQHSLFAPSPF
jgi:hypothetical protein